MMTQFSWVRSHHPFLLLTGINITSEATGYKSITELTEHPKMAIGKSLPWAVGNPSKVRLRFSDVHYRRANVPAWVTAGTTAEQTGTPMGGTFLTLKGESERYSPGSDVSFNSRVTATADSRVAIPQENVTMPLNFRNTQGCIRQSSQKDSGQ